MNASSSSAASSTLTPTNGNILSSKLSLRDIDVTNRRILVRVDFNVPMVEKKKNRWSITDDTRIRETLPTINYLRGRRAKVVLMSHLGRPADGYEKKYSLEPVAERLAELLDHPVQFSTDCTGKGVENRVDSMQDRDVLLLENLRFHPQEEQNDPSFAQALARLADVYVNDAFGTAHRAHASTAGIAGYLPEAVMGLLMEKELKYLQEELSKPKHPFVVILGGAKVSDKIGVIQALMEKADTFLIGGAMAYTFYRALGIPTGKSRVEEDKVDLAREILELAKSKKVEFILPVDNIETQEIKPGAVTRNTDCLNKEKGISDDWESVDIGKETIAIFKEHIAKAKTILWNGPVGIFEIPDFSKGTMSIAEAVADASATTIVGGGDSVKAVKQAKVADRISFISTGGGASLELLEGKELPGLVALTDK